MMNSDYAKLSPDGQAVAYFDDAANKFRGYFESELLAALPDFARRALEKDWAALPDLKNSDPIPPLIYASLIRGERCAHDLLSMNYEGHANSHFRKRVNEAADAVKAAVVASWIERGNVISFPATDRKRTGAKRRLSIVDPAL